MQPEHPDLVEIDQHIRTHLDRVLRAEQLAADLVRRRIATLRDRLIDLEEAADSVIVVLPAGEVAGVLDNVGADHIELASASGVVLVPLNSISSVRRL
ncbi:MAG TPA: hypothetical protein VLB67_12085 [Acidimicrobiia bacterium]|nr:hypothetical protein [Acidimicrobiia bacterium]